jgi:hypothetical protein
MEQTPCHDNKKSNNRVFSQKKAIFTHKPLLSCNDNDDFALQIGKGFNPMIARYVSIPSIESPYCLENWEGRRIAVFFIDWVTGRPVDWVS